MENRKVRWGMFVTLLTFVLVLAACGSGPNPFSQLFSVSVSRTGSGPGTNEFRTRYTDHGAALVIVNYTSQSEAVVIPAEFEGIPVAAIGAEAFSGNKTIKSVTIPEGITIIEKDAFDGCTALTDITIPASIIRIGAKGDDAEDSFDGCTGLTGLTVAEANGVYSSEDGVLFNKEKTALLLCPEGKSGSYTIPSSVTSVVDSAFQGCRRLTGLTIPDSVTSIGRSAFNRCAGLTSVTIPDSVTSIGELAFANCTGLTAIIIPGSIKIITGDVRDGMVYGAFIGCTGLTSVTIPDSVTSIGGGAFQNCTGLTSIIIPDSVTSIGDSAFNTCSGLTSITIPDGVTSIGQQAFQDSGLTSVTIPDSVAYIGANAFAECAELTSVTVSPVNGRTWDNIGGRFGAFAGCPKLSAASQEALRRAGYTEGF